MTESVLSAAPAAELQEELGWMPGARVEACPTCKRVFLVPAAKSKQPCPLCYRSLLAPQPAIVPRMSPEIVLPVQLKNEDLNLRLTSFLDKTPFRQEDLSVENLVNRSQVVWWPLWLVDADLQGEWTGTLGFDYQVKTAKESYGSDGWSTRSTLRTQTRYEPRKGTLERHYDNIQIPALEAHEKRLHQIGGYQPSSAVPYRVGMLGQTIVQLPEIEPQALVEVAQTRFHAAAEEEIMQANAAQHRQQIRFTGQYLNLNWTKYLLPLISTWYRDEEGNVQPVVINGQSGRVYGKRLASVSQASRLTFGLISIPVVVLLISIILSLLAPAALPISLTFGVGIAFFLAILALLPLIRAHHWNNQQQKADEFK